MRTRDRLTPQYWLAADPEVGSLADESIAVGYIDVMGDTIFDRMHRGGFSFIVTPLKECLMVELVGMYTADDFTTYRLGIAVCGSSMHGGLVAAYSLWQDSIIYGDTAHLSRRRKIWRVIGGRARPSKRWSRSVTYPLRAIKRRAAI